MIGAHRINTLSAGAAASNATISYVNYLANANANASSMSLTGIQSGDRVFYVEMVETGSSRSTPSGWTLVNQRVSTYGCTSVFYRVSAGTSVSASFASSTSPKRLMFAFRATGASSTTNTSLISTSDGNSQLFEISTVATPMVAMAAYGKGTTEAGTFLWSTGTPTELTVNPGDGELRVKYLIYNSGTPSDTNIQMEAPGTIIHLHGFYMRAT